MDSPGWPKLAHEYQELISDESLDSRFLREAGLIPNILDLLGPCDKATLLDAGTGSGWLFHYVKPKAAFACDIVRPEHLPNNIEFKQDAIEHLSYADDTFDTIVASLVLIYCANLDVVCRELYRVAKRKTGRLVVSLMHPYFYRTGTIDKTGKFVLDADLSKPARLPLRIAGQVGPFEYYYRPLPDYLNALVRANWIITEVRDWFIDMEQYSKANLQSSSPRSGAMPLFSFIACRASEGDFDTLAS